MLLSLQHSLLDKIVLSKFKVRSCVCMRACIAYPLRVHTHTRMHAHTHKPQAPLGGCLDSSFVGGSAMPVEVANFFENIGVAICEGYGLTVRVHVCVYV